MKYISKFFEAKEEDDIQYQEIESIFYQYVDDEVCDIFNDNASIIRVVIYKDDINSSANDLAEYDILLDSMMEDIKYYKKIRNYLTRLDIMDYKWHISYKDSYVTIDIDRENKELTLADAFGGSISTMNHVLSGIMKRVMLSKYKLKFNTHSEGEHRTGYRSTRSQINLYFDEKIPEYHQVIKDLRSLKKLDKISSYGGIPKYEEIASFYTVKVDDWYNSDKSVIKIEI